MTNHFHSADKGQENKLPLLSTCKCTELCVHCSMSSFTVPIPSCFAWLQDRMKDLRNTKSLYPEENSGEQTAKSHNTRPYTMEGSDKQAAPVKKQAAFVCPTTPSAGLARELESIAN